MSNSADTPVLSFRAMRASRPPSGSQTVDMHLGVEISQSAVSAMDEMIQGAKKTNEVVSKLPSDIEQQLNSIRELSKATESVSPEADVPPVTVIEYNHPAEEGVEVAG